MALTAKEREKLILELKAKIDTGTAKKWEKIQYEGMIAREAKKAGINERQELRRVIAKDKHGHRGTMTSDGYRDYSRHY